MLPKPPKTGLYADNVVGMDTRRMFNITSMCLVSIAVLLTGAAVTVTALASSARKR